MSGASKGLRQAQAEWRGGGLSTTLLGAQAPGLLPQAACRLFIGVRKNEKGRPQAAFFGNGLEASGLLETPFLAILVAAAVRFYHAALGPAPAANPC